MKASMFALARYLEPYAAAWPAPVDEYSDEVANRSFQQSLDMFEAADQLGFDWVTVAEHHFSGFSLTPNPMLMAGALTQRVKRAKIAILGPTLPILNPVRVAEEFAMLDALTGGRVVAGMMRGTANEYVTYNTNPAESRARFEEALELIVKAWTEPQPFAWQGRFFEYRSISIWPRPVQKPHPPIYMSASSPESAAYAARNHLGAGFAVTTRDLAARASREYRAHANEAGWDPTPEDIIYRVGIHVAETDEQAYAHLGGLDGGGYRLGRTNTAVEKAVAATGYHGQDGAAQRARHQRGGSLREQIENAQIFAGSPETVISQIKRVRDEIGAGILDLTLRGNDHDARMQSLELIGTKVLPRIREF